jgi:hypothetical protein
VQPINVLGRISNRVWETHPMGAEEIRQKRAFGRSDMAMERYPSSNFVPKVESFAPPNTFFDRGCMRGVKQRTHVLKMNWV